MPRKVTLFFLLVFTPSLVLGLTFPDRSLVDSQTRLGFGLLSDSLKSRPNDNVIVSPAALLIQMTLAHDAAGAEGRSAMLAMMGLPGYSEQQINAATSGFVEILDMYSDGPSEMAVSLWKNEQTRFLQPYSGLLAGFKVAEGNYDPAGQKINDWLKTLFSQTPALKKMPKNCKGLVLLDLAWFKPEWSIAFDPSRTKPAAFSAVDGASKTVPMMSQSGFFTYLQNRDFQAVGIPSFNGDITVYLILPENTQSVADLSRKLTAEQWAAWEPMFSDAEGYIEVPKLRVFTELDAADQLKKSKASILFGKKPADLSAAVQAKTSFEAVLQKNCLDLSEAGSPPPPPVFDPRTLKKHTFFNLSLNRPFLFIVKHNITGVILLCGAVQRPE